MKADTYTTQGKKAGSVELPENVFGVAWNASLMHQVVTAMQDNARTMVAHVKMRGEVRGGGKKPWQQKGTGRARHGSTRSPIWKGGGVTHGPRNDKSYTRTIPKKMRAKALFMALSRKLADNELIFIDSFGLDTPKTAVARKALSSLGTSLKNGIMGKARNAALIALADPKDATTKSFRNLGNVECKAVRDLNPLAVMKYTYLIIENPEASVAILTHRAHKKVVAEGTAPKKRAVKPASTRETKSTRGGKTK